MKSILNYHEIERSFSPFFSTISPEKFKKHLLFFKRKGIELIDFKDFFKKKRGIVITFDDGFKSLYQYLPEIMEEFNFRPIIFIVTGFIGKRGDWDVWIKRGIHLNEYEIKRLAELGVIFGSHTHNHPLLTALENDGLKFELEYSKKFLEDLTGKKVEYISYPFGKYNDKVVGMAKEIGYSKGFISTPVKVKESDFNIGRWSVYLIDTYFNLMHKDDTGGIIPFLEAKKCKAINNFSFLTYYLNH